MSRVDPFPFTVPVTGVWLSLTRWWSRGGSGPYRPGRERRRPESGEVQVPKPVSSRFSKSLWSGLWGCRVHPFVRGDKDRPGPGLGPRRPSDLWPYRPVPVTVRPSGRRGGTRLRGGTRKCECVETVGGLGHVEALS